MPALAAENGSTKTEPLSIDPVPGEPEGAAGVETRRSRKRSRATPHLPQVSLCCVRSGRESHSGVPVSHLLFLCLRWRLDWNSSGFPEGVGGLLAPTLLPVRAQLQVGKFSCACRSAPPTLETMRPKQEWEMRLNRIRMTKQSVRVSSC